LVSICSPAKQETRFLLLQQKESEDTPYLTQDQRQELSHHKYALDYKFLEDELDFLDKNGYLVLKGLFDKQTCQNMVTELFERAHTLIGLDRMDNTTWTHEKLGNKGFIDIWHNPFYYKLRQNPALYSVFAQLFKKHDLTVSLDKVCMKAPFYIEDDNNKRITFPELHAQLSVHNDLNLWHLGETKYQGGLCLEDCPIGAGGFVCIPGMHKLDKIREYRRHFEEGKLTHGIPMQPPHPSQLFVYFKDETLIQEKLVEVPMEQGDFLIWSSRLPHANGRNKTNRWRLQCFITFVPDNNLYAKYRKEVARCVLSGNIPSLYSTLNSTDFNDTKEATLHKAIELTWLGERLLGLKSWKASQ